MGINIKIPDANFTKSLGAILPFNSNLVGYWNFSAGLTEGRKNQVTGLIASLIGSPTVVDGALQINRKKGLLTNLVVDSDKTFISLASFDGDAIFISSIDYSNPTGVKNQDGIYVVGNSPRVQINDTTGASLTDASLANTAFPYIFAGTIDSSGSDIYVYDGKSSASNNKASTNIKRDTNLLRIGGWSEDAERLNGNAEVYITLVYNRKLSASELETVFAYLKSKSALFDT